MTFDPSTTSERFVPLRKDSSTDVLPPDWTTNCREIAFTPSFAVATNVKIPELVGVPLMAPFGDRLRPGGIEGADHKTVPAPPVAVSV